MVNGKLEESQVSHKAVGQRAGFRGYTWTLKGSPGPLSLPGPGACSWVLGLSQLLSRLSITRSKNSPCSLRISPQLLFPTQPLGSHFRLGASARRALWLVSSWWHQVCASRQPGAWITKLRAFPGIWTYFGEKAALFVLPFSSAFPFNNRRQLYFEQESPPRPSVFLIPVILSMCIFLWWFSQPLEVSGMLN